MIINAEVRKLLTLPAIRLTALLTVAATALLVVAGADGGQVLHLAQAGFLILGVLATTQEYQSGGQIRTTLLAVPRRPVLAVAKAAALGAVTVPVAAVIALVTLVVGTEATASWGDVARAACGLFLTALLAGAVGLLLRQPLPAVTVLLPTFLIAAPLVRAWQPSTATWLPFGAPAEGTIALVGWTLVIAAAATLALRTRDG